MLEVVRVGVAVMIINGDKVLLGKRINTLNSGVYALPGGKPDFGENPIDTACRECMEETGLQLCKEHLNQAGWINNPFPDDDIHYVTLVYVTDHFHGTPKVKEPDRCAGWDWYSIKDLPKPMWQGLTKFMKGKRDEN